MRRRKRVVATVTWSALLGDFGACYDIPRIRGPVCDGRAIFLQSMAAVYIASFVDS